MHILVIGGTGLIGSNIVLNAENVGHQVSSTWHTNDDSSADYRLDKTDTQDVTNLIDELRPDAVIDTAAFHDVDACEAQRDKAWSVNAAGTRNIAAATAAVDAHYVFLSTDYVFPGDGDDSPYNPEDPVAPANYYARTKLAGEQAARIPENWTVLRTSVVYGTERENFATWALSEFKTGNELTIVDDQISSPTYAPDIARASIQVVEQEITGTNHAAGPVSLSRDEFTRRLAEVYKYDSDRISPISTEDFGQTAPRPADSSLDSTGLYELLDWRFKTPADAFREMATAE